jgi:thiamine-phosphate pyrophosphorylase
MTLQRVEFKLYLISDRKLFSSTAEFVESVGEALAAGVKAVQLREKDLSTRELLDMSYKFRALTASYGAKLFINDRLDIALSVDADGIHIGQSGIPVREIRRVAGNGLMIGCSTHSIKEAMEAEKDGADFITFGPLFPTPSKLKYGEPVGMDALREAKKKVGLPIFGIGGIKSENIEDVMNSGASGVALISGILSARDKASATREYLKKVGERQ